MQAVRFRQHGDPAEVLSVEEVPSPSPSQGEVLVRMLASPINPSDLLHIEGRYELSPEFPATPGFEGVGVVEASGGGLMGKLLVGKRVTVLNRRGGNWAEQAVIPAKQAIPVPQDIPLDQAATFFVNPATAIVMTQKILSVPKGDWLLQSAAGSSLGRMIIRLAKHSGFRTLNIVRRESQIAELKELGADEVLKFDASTDDADAFVEHVRELTGGGVRYAVDPVAGIVGSALVRCLRSHGRLLTYGTLTDEPFSIVPRHLIGPQASIEGFWLGRWMNGQSLLTKVRLMRQVAKLIRADILTSDISARIPLAEVVTSLTAGLKGKSLIITSPENP